MSFKTIAGGFNGAFWWYGPLSEDQEFLKQIYQNYLVALILFCWRTRAMHVQYIQKETPELNLVLTNLGWNSGQIYM